MNNKGIALFHLAKYEDSVTIFQASLKLDTKNPLTLNNLGSSLFYLKKYDEALKILDQALNQIENFYEPLINKANVMIAKDNLGEALAIFNKAAKINLSPHVYNGYGMICQKQKKYSEALANFDKALELDSNYAEALCNKGSVLIELNKLEEATNILKKSIEVDENNPEAYNNLGVALFKQNKLEEA